MAVSLQKFPYVSRGCGQAASCEGASSLTKPDFLHSVLLVVPRRKVKVMEAGNSSPSFYHNGWRVVFQGKDFKQWKCSIIEFSLSLAAFLKQQFTCPFNTPVGSPWLTVLEYVRTQRSSATESKYLVSTTLPCTSDKHAVGFKVVLVTRHSSAFWFYSRNRKGSVTKAVASFLLLSWECNFEGGLGRRKAELKLPSQASGLRRGMWLAGTGRVGEHRQGSG